jgi:succinate dehydrogenase/fumarate reductase flavoprotein subunit
MSSLSPLSKGDYQQSADQIFDLIIVGSGAGGLSAAITAKLHGLDVLVVEKEAQYGGTTARSGGWLWIPMNPLAIEAGVKDSIESAKTYLRHETGAFYDEKRIDAFLKTGPEMIGFFQEHTAVRFDAGYLFPDYHPDTAGGMPGGRPIVAAAFDARELGIHLPKLARPFRALGFAGLAISSGNDLLHFFNFSRSMRSFVYVIKRMASHGLDLLRFGRSMRLVNGNALAGRLGKSLFELGIPLWLSSPATELIREGHRVVGLKVMREGKQVALRARRGVVLAAGGFPHDQQRRKRLYRHDPHGKSHWPLPPKGNTGDGASMAEAIGARFFDAFPQAAAWAPVSEVRWPDGETGLYPHFVDRGKPGIIAVNERGMRFVNESSSYHDFVQAMIADAIDPSDVKAWFIADRRAIRRYGLGMVRPWPVPMGWWIKSAYIQTAQTLPLLAKKIGVDEEALVQTVNEFNQHALEGRDPMFHRGANAYGRAQGDAKHPGKNPSLAALDVGPFFALRIRPGELGSFAGLQTDEQARVLNREGGIIEGLYAVGNDAASIMGGNYPGGGITLGPAMTFGYLAARHAAGVQLLAEQSLNLMAFAEQERRVDLDRPAAIHQQAQNDPRDRSI